MCLARFWSCPDPTRRTLWVSLQHCSESDSSTRARQSSRSRAPTVASHRTPPPAPATAACPRRYASATFARTRWHSQASRRRMKKRVRTSDGSRRRGGPSRSTGSATRKPRQSTSQSVSREHSTRGAPCPNEDRYRKDGPHDCPCDATKRRLQSHSSQVARSGNALKRLDLGEKSEMSERRIPFSEPLPSLPSSWL